jgi:hypothetical protein
LYYRSSFRRQSGKKERAKGGENDDGEQIFDKSSFEILGRGRKTQLSPKNSNLSLSHTSTRHHRVRKSSQQ